MSLPFSRSSPTNLALTCVVIHPSVITSPVLLRPSLVSSPAFLTAFFVFDPAFLISLVCANAVVVANAPTVPSVRNTNKPYVAHFMQSPPEGYESKRQAWLCDSEAHAQAIAANCRAAARGARRAHRTRPAEVDAGPRASAAICARKRNGGAWRQSRRDMG